MEQKVRFEDTMRLFEGRKAVKLMADEMDIPAALAIAITQIGEREVAGTGTNPIIADYFTATSYRATSDEVPWCSAFACWCCESAGILSPRSASALAWINWNNSKGRRESTSAPRRGDILVYARPEAGPTAGHVGFYASTENNGLWVLGGNQGNEVSIVLRKDKPLAVLGWMGLQETGL
jgi:uncharacterized protein (TIGR02594 family)